MTTKIHDLIRAFGVACDRAARAPRMSPAQAAALQLENAARVALTSAVDDLAQRIAELEAERDKAHGELIVRASDLRLMTEERDTLRARLAALEQQEAVAVIGSGYQMLWVHTGTLMDAVKKHGIKVGSTLYARPVPTIPSGCGACGDACTKRGSCRLADESPEAAR